MNRVNDHDYFKHNHPDDYKYHDKRYINKITNSNNRSKSIISLDSSLREDFKITKSKIKYENFSKNKVKLFIII